MSATHTAIHGQNLTEPDEKLSAVYEAAPMSSRYFVTSFLEVTDDFIAQRPWKTQQRAIIAEMASCMKLGHH